MKNQIAKLLSKTPTMPILFVGSGLTRRYLDLPNWETLLRRFCLTKPYEYYHFQAARESSDLDEMLLPRIANLIESDYNELWFTSSEFEQNREKHKKLISQKISPFKIEIGDYFASTNTQIVSRYEAELEKFSQIGSKNIACILTTNYDCFLENCFGKESFKTFIGQNDLLFSTTYEIGELYKIHGCCTRPETIVINENDYRRFIQKQSYLSAKILTMFLERPIIFIGYSITDPNIKRILASVSECLENEQLEKLKERLIFIEWNNTEDRKDVISERRLNFESGKTIIMNNVLLSDYTSLYDAILTNTVKYDVKILRRIKSQLYELVRDNKPNEKLHVISDIEDDQEIIDFVVGVGAYGKFGDIGYRGIKAEEIFQYVIGQSKREFDSDMILKEAMPALKNRGTLPIFKLIAECKSIDNISSIALEAFKTRNDLSVLINGVDKKWIEKHGHLSCRSVIDYYKQHGFNKTCTDIPKMDFSVIDADELKAFILLALSENPGVLSIETPTHSYRSSFKKCICIWDYLKYRSEAIQRLSALQIDSPAKE